MLNLSTEELRAEESSLRKSIAESYEATAGRPDLDLRALIASVRNGMGGASSGGSDYRADLKARQLAWDLAHPTEAALVVKRESEVEREELIQKELQRRYAEAAAEERALGVLEDVPRIQAKVRAGLSPTEATGIIAEWESAPALWCLLLMGGVGCGKSTAAGAHIAKEARKKSRWTPIWVRAVEASRMSAFGQEAEERFGSWRCASVLVVDDLGTELMTPTWQQALDDILDYRYEHSLRTILPTNLRAADFKARYGERISDRIRQDGMVRELSGGSMRQVRHVDRRASPPQSPDRGTDP
jgi:DNA replication protein DnaC